MSRDGRLYVGKLPEHLREIARGEAHLEDRLEPVDVDDPEVEAFLEETSAYLKLSGVEIGREASGELAVDGRAEDGSSVRATASAVVVTLASARPIAPLGEPGLREALRAVFRLASEMPGDGLMLADARHEGPVVYAIYKPFRHGPLGRAFRRLVVWCDGNLLVVAMKPRAEEATEVEGEADS